MLFSSLSLVISFRLMCTYDGYSLHMLFSVAHSDSLINHYFLALVYQLQ